MIALRFLALTGAFTLLLATHASFVRPWYMRWGATDAEVRGALLGDQIVPVAREGAMTTRAITIRAPIADVWPWVAQLGQDRGGFYSYELLEDLAGCEMENTDRIHPEFQQWKVGDRLWMYPPEKAGGMGHALLVALEPGRALGFATRQFGTPPSAPYDGSWSFVLEPIDERTTRLIARGRGGGERSFLGSAFDRFVFDPIHFVMERKTMHGIKLLAEGGRASELADIAQVVLWTITFAIFMTSAVLVLRSKRWLGALATFAAAGGVFQILTFVQPAPLIGALLVLVVSALLWLPSKPTPRWATRERPVALAGAASGH